MPTHLIQQSVDSIADLIEEDVVAPHVATQSVKLDGEEDADGEPEFTPRPAPKYVQAVVQGQQAHLVTNLLEGATRTLLQAQMIWTMGRNREAGMPIHDRLMSRRHAVLMFDEIERAFFFADLNSMNGSYLNGVRVQGKQRLQDGDFLRVGNTEFFFFISQEQRMLEPLHSEVCQRLMNPVKQTPEGYAEAQESEAPEAAFQFRSLKR
jgi:pSer/pThr/pTyr-binding forkhead associated (FHA) protein